VSGVSSAPKGTDSHTPTHQPTIKNVTEGNKDTLQMNGYSRQCSGFFNASQGSILPETKPIMFGEVVEPSKQKRFFQEWGIKLQSHISGGYESKPRVICWVSKQKYQVYA